VAQGVDSREKRRGEVRERGREVPYKSLVVIAAIRATAAS